MYCTYYFYDFSGFFFGAVPATDDDDSDDYDSTGEASNPLPSSLPPSSTDTFSQPSSDGGYASGDHSSQVSSVGGGAITTTPTLTPTKQSAALHDIMHMSASEGMMGGSSDGSKNSGGFMLRDSSQAGGSPISAMQTPSIVVDVAPGAPPIGIQYITYLHTLIAVSKSTCMLTSVNVRM